MLGKHVSRRVIIISVASCLSVIALPIAAGAAVKVSLHVGPAHVESATDPELVRHAPIPDPGQPTLRALMPSSSSTTISTAPSAPAPMLTLTPMLSPMFSSSTAAPATTQSATTPTSTNLIANPSFESGSGSTPDGWLRGGYGANTRVLTYPATPAHTGSRAAQVKITSYTSGDAKWYFTPIPVQGGATYNFSDWYESNVPTEVDAQVTHTDGSVSYVVLGKPAASPTYAQFTDTFTMPNDAKSVTVFHVINSVGTLTVDDYSLVQGNGATSNNYLPNGDFESQSGSLPADWEQGGWGSNTRNFTYPVSGDPGKAAEVTISNYQSGDAKWASALVTLPEGSYEYSDNYKSTVPSVLTVQFEQSDGSFTYTDLKKLPASSGWATSSAYLTIPSGVKAVRVFHLINQNGSLTIDNASITKATSASSGIFSSGAVTFRFDDGDEDQYVNALPVLQAAGFKGTFYIITHQIADNGYPGYVSLQQIRQMYADGEEIGAHTQTHPHLTTLSAAQQQQEIAGSRQDLLSWNIGPILSFAYPYGEYNDTTIGIVKQAGFQSAAATISGYVTPNSDPYQLEYQEPRSTVSLSQIENWVDTAKQTHSWLILTFHDINNDGSLYSTPPAEFQQIVQYVKQSGLPVVTVSEGMQSL